MDGDLAFLDVFAVEAKRQKLVAMKEQWAREAKSSPTKASTNRRLPPGQHEVKDWPILDLGTHPNIPAKDWKMQVGGLVDRPQSFTYQDLHYMPARAQVSDIHCVTFWSRFDNHWQGIATRDLLEEVRVSEKARFALIKSYDGYSTNLPIDYLFEEDSLLATGWEGKPLTREHGGPVRLVVPSLYFWKSAKWVHSIRFVAEDVPGFWESRGYHPLGEPWTGGRYR